MSLPQLLKVWRNEKTLFSPTPFVLWPWGKAMWRGVIRAYHLDVLTLAVTAVVYVLGQDRQIANWVLDISLVVWLTMLAGIFSISLFNWPKKLVAPHLRSQPGAVKEWSEALVKSRLVARIRRWLSA